MKLLELDPEDRDAHLKLASIYLVARQPAKAREEAAVVLGKDPKNFDALLLWASTATTPQEVDAAILRLEGARAQYGDKAPSRQPGRVPGAGQKLFTVPEKPSVTF